MSEDIESHRGLGFRVPSLGRIRRADKGARGEALALGHALLVVE